MRTGIIGGTFNPPHIGHINAARAAKSKLLLDRIIFIPAGIPPHKAMDATSASTGERFEMTKIAAGIAAAEVSDIEMRREGKSFTVDTLRELKKTYPDDEFWLIMGTDMFLSLETWREAENIFRLANLAAVPRDAEDMAELREFGRYLRDKYGAISEIIEAQAITISSSELRAAIERGELLKFLPDEIYNYIVEKGLYGISGSDKC